MGFVSFFDNFIQIVILLIAWLIVVISFFIMAIQLFVSLIEFKLTTLAGFVLVPFGLFGRTAFLAEKVLGNVFSSGVKVLVLAVIVGIGSTIFGQFTSGFNNPPTIDDALTLILAALALLGLSIFGAGIANGLVAGGPQLGAGAAVGAGIGCRWLGSRGRCRDGRRRRRGRRCDRGAARAGAGVAGGATAALPRRRRRRRRRRGWSRLARVRSVEVRQACATASGWRPVRDGRFSTRPRRARGRCRRDLRSSGLGHPHEAPPDRQSRRLGGRPCRRSGDRPSGGSSVDLSQGS